MKLGGIDRRLVALEERAKPRIIATLADFVIWCSEDEPDEDVKLSPQMQELVDEASKHIGEEGNTSGRELGMNSRAA